MKLSNLSQPKYRWLALVVLALSLAIIIIDNSVLNVAVPYILRDFQTSLDSIQWVISGYALIIATLLILMGRLGDLFGRKKVFLIGLVFFAIGSFIASVSPNVKILFIGEALIEAIGAAMMMTSSLSLLVTEFQGRERAIAFGVWGSVAGAAASLGPLLGGYFTTYYSWRWSLRINVIVAIVALVGSVFVKEAKGEGERKFDWLGTVLSGLGLFSLVFALIEGRKYGWFRPNEFFSLFGWHWPYGNLSIIPIVFFLAVLFLGLFIYWEYKVEKAGGSPVVRLSVFRNSVYSIGLTTVTITSLGQFGVFFILPIYVQNVLGRNAFQTGVMFLSTSITAFIVGPISGFVASKLTPKWIVTIGMFLFSLGVYLLYRTIGVDSNGLTLAPALIVLGFGIAMTAAQLTNIVLSSVPQEVAGEASAVNSTLRQVGTAIGIAVLGVVLSSAVTFHVKDNISKDPNIPAIAKPRIIEAANSSSVESGQTSGAAQNIPPKIASAIKTDINNALVSASKKSLIVALIFVLAGSIVSIFIRPKKRSVASQRESSQEA